MLQLVNHTHFKYGRSFENDFKSIKKNGAVTINYYKNGLLQTFKGKVQRLDLTDQTLSLKDEQQNTFSIRLSGIKEIY